ncbi:MAG: calcium/sodium antiporter [Hyphomicrobiaceae bacterium]
MVSSTILILVGFGLLVAGGEVLVRGAVQLAERLRVSAFVIGAVIIGFGSSMPELVTSIEAGLLGAPGIALGNIVGSNIINILVVLGIAALIAPIVLTTSHVRTDTIIVCGLTVAFVALCALLELTPAIGAVLLIVLSIYLIYAVRRERHIEVDDGSPFPEPAGAHDAASAASRPERESLLVMGGSVLAGLGLLVLGGHLVVGSAVSLAMQIGVSETVVGLTIVAFGTSLPEIVTAVVAALRRQADVALGNVLGSCVFNLLAIGGTIALISPTDVPVEIVRFDNFVMLAAAVLLLAAVYFSRQLNRPLGAVFLGGYAFYLTAIWQ